MCTYYRFGEIIVAFYRIASLRDRQRRRSLNGAKLAYADNNSDHHILERNRSLVRNVQFQLILKKMKTRKFRKKNTKTF